ncbi:glycosyltransferase family 4 protein [Micromonospora chersina]|uniref:glycosyltransferase family 4 protein n=1 Tax=Micromonospora chersina TaxID=47854 RepID=UPI003719E220
MSTDPGVAGEVHVVLPGDIDDPATRSGGNRYDRRMCQGLREQGWVVHEHELPGDWPRPDERVRAGLARLLWSLPRESLVVLDGLVASTVPGLLQAQRGRLRCLVLVHTPLITAAEQDAFRAAAAILTTSDWTRRLLLKQYGLAAERVHVAYPGTDPAAVSAGTESGTALLCVASHKGHDTLVEALGQIRDLPWTFVWAGSLTRHAPFVRHVRASLDSSGVADRVTLAGPLRDDQLDAAYANADLLVLPSRIETFGMVVTEALARGIPVLTTTSGGLPETVGHATDGQRPGLLVAPAQPAALASALRRWLEEPELRRRLRQAALERRHTLPSWSRTTTHIIAALRAADPDAVRTAATTAGQ